MAAPSTYHLPTGFVKSRGADNPNYRQTLSWFGEPYEKKMSAFNAYYTKLNDEHLPQFHDLDWNQTVFCKGYIEDEAKSFDEAQNVIVQRRPGEIPLINVDQVIEITLRGDRYFFAYAEIKDYALSYVHHLKKICETEKIRIAWNSISDDLVDCFNAA